MSKKKRHNTAEIAAKLSEADALAAAGRTQSDISKALAISIMTLHRWRKARPEQSPLASATVSDPPEHGRLGRIAELQLENSRLRKLVTDLLLEKMRLEDEQQSLGGRTAKRA
jgi:hypothetical protein